MDHKESKSLTVFASDIHRIGHTTYGKDGNTRFVCDADTSNIEAILLRETLSLYGYRITEENDFVSNGGEPFNCDIEFVTDMPFDEYMSLVRS